MDKQAIETEKETEKETDLETQQFRNVFEDVRLQNAGASEQGCGTAQGRPILGLIAPTGDLPDTSRPMKAIFNIFGAVMALRDIGILAPPHGATPCSA